MEPKSVKTSKPFLPQISFSDVAEGGGGQTNVLKFTSSPDINGVGNLTVKAKGWSNQTQKTILIYCLGDDHDTNMTLHFKDSKVCTSGVVQFTPTLPQTSCAGYFAVMVQTQNPPNVPSTIASTDILNIPGYKKFTVVGPSTPTATITQINTGIDSWVSTQQDTLLTKVLASKAGDDQDPSLPNLNTLVSDLKTSGVPNEFFTNDVQNNLTIMIQQYNESFQLLKESVRVNGPKAEVALKNGTSVSWGCWWCKVGFCIALTLLTCAITVAIAALLPTGLGEAAVGGLAAYIVVWFNVVAATASTIASGLIGTLVTLGSVSIAAILVNLPDLLCEATGSCKK